MSQKAIELKTGVISSVYEKLMFLGIHGYLRTLVYA